MVDMFQESRVKMYSDRLMERPAINQAQVLSTEVLTSLLTLNINHYSRLNLSNTQIKHMKQLHRLSVFKDNKIHIRK